jgi:peroxiredoxin
MKRNGFVNLLHRLFFRIIIILIVSACGSSEDVAPGTSAPDFTLQAVRGGEYRLQDLPLQPVLLSFLNTQAEGCSATSDPSRAQIVFLKSMREQYSSKRLTVLIVDAAHIATGKYPTQDKLFNFTYDWQLDNIPVLDDSKGSVTKSYGVETLPTTFLIGTDGMIKQRWDGFASASQLALSIESVVGAPAQRQVDTVQSPAPSPASACPNETQPQAKFAGVGLARPLSKDLWVVDGGKSWGVGLAFPLQLILLDTQNVAQQASMHIQVLGQYTDSIQIIPLVDQSMELLSSDVAGGLLSGESTAPPMYSLLTTVWLERVGCIEIRSVVTREGTTNQLYSGSLFISAR